MIYYDSDGCHFAIGSLYNTDPGGIGVCSISPDKISIWFDNNPENERSFETVPDSNGAILSTPVFSRMWAERVSNGQA